MKKIKQQFRRILESKCLSTSEKNYLAGIFKEFSNTREVIGRNKIHRNSEANDLDNNYYVDGITGGQ